MELRDMKSFWNYKKIKILSVNSHCNLKTDQTPSETIQPRAVVCLMDEEFRMSNKFTFNKTVDSTGVMELVVEATLCWNDKENQKGEAC